MAQFQFTSRENMRQGNVSQSNVGAAQPISVYRNMGQVRAPKGSSDTGSAVAKLLTMWADKKQKEWQAEKDQREILQGMSMAAQGQAIDEIAKKDSWQNKIFGKTNLVDGARAYYSAHAGNGVLQDIQNHMPELARMDPEQAREVVQQRIAHGARTGDQMLDFQIQQQVLQKVPQILKTQAKLNYEWKQENIAHAQREAFTSSIDVAGQTLQQLAQDPNTSAKDIAVAVQGVREALMPVEGQDREAWEKNVVEVLKMQAVMAGRPRRITQEDGTVIEHPGTLWNLEVARASEVLDALSPDSAATVLRAFEDAENRARKRYADAYSAELADLQAMAMQPKVGANASMLLADIDNLNRRYQTETGSSVPLIDSDQKKALLSSNLQAITRANERAQDRAFAIQERRAAEAARRRDASALEHAKMQMKLQKDAFIMQNAHQIGRLEARGVFKESEIQAVMNEHIDGQQTPTDRLVALSRWKDHIHKGTRHDIQNTMRAMKENPDFATKSPDSMMEQAQRFIAMKEVLGPEKTSEYYGEHYKTMEAFTKALQTNNNPAAAWQTATSPIYETFGSNTSSMKAASQIIEDNSAWWLAELVGMSSDESLSTELRGTSRAVLQGALAREYEDALKDTGDEALAKTRAWNRVKAGSGMSPVQIFGGLVVEAPGGSSKRMDTWLTSSKVRGDGRDSIPTDRLQDAVEDTISRELHGRKGRKGAIDSSKNWIFKSEAASTKITQIEVDGMPMFAVSGIDEDGEPFAFHVTGDQIMKDWLEHGDPRKPKPGVGSRIGGAVADVIAPVAEGLAKAANRVFK